MIEKFCIRLKINFFKKYDWKKNKEQQSRITINGIHKSYENCDYCTFMQEEVLTARPIYVGFPLLELSKLHM